MSAFLAYGGAYEFDGREYRWRCYATARVHALRKREHGPNPNPPMGLKWITTKSRHQGEPELSWLLDEDIGEFSQMLVQVEPLSASIRKGQFAAH
jgi:hypothetical protein